MDGKWNEKLAIMERKWMKYMLISDGKMDKSMVQQLECFQFEKGFWVISKGYQELTMCLYILDTKQSHFNWRHGAVVLAWPHVIFSKKK